MSIIDHALNKYEMFFHTYDLFALNNNNNVIICESRATRKVAQSIRIQKSNQWILKNNNFKINA